MSRSPLALVDEELAAEFASATGQRRARIAGEAVSSAFTKAGVTEPFVRDRADGTLSVDPSDRAELAARQEKLDEQYLGLHGKFNSEEGLSEDEAEIHDRLFDQARALQALIHLADNEHEEAVYEALHVGLDEAASELRRLLSE